MEYQYTPLSEANDEIRLLHLLSGKREDPIHILIEHQAFTADRIPEYEALSYTWGEPTDCDQITVGENCESTLSVTKNLAEALPYLRREDTCRTFWIDAICVNQKDLDERSRQVSLMAALYSRANLVLVWLGPESQNSNEAIDCIELLGSKIHADWHSTSIRALTDEKHWASTSQALPFDHKQFRSLQDFFGRAWFQRLWVWQEVRSSKERALVQCGQRLLTWHAISTAYLCLACKPFSVGIQGDFRPHPAVGSICDPRKHNFADLLNRTRLFQCRDPRDKVFAILSFLDKSDAGFSLCADYTKTVSDTYTGAALEWMGSSRDLFMLELVTTPHHTRDLPSWVPDWTLHRRVRISFMAFAASSSRASWSLDGRTLKARGKSIGIVNAVWPLSPPSWSIERTMVEHVKSEVSCIVGAITVLVAYAALPGIFLRDRELQGALCRVLSRNEMTEYYEVANSDFSSRHAISEAVRQALHPTENFRVADHSAGWGPIINSCADRSLLLLEDGSLGLGPTNAQPGDRVSVLLGCNSAIILRNAGTGTFQAIGPAYIDGFMHGEALFGRLPDHVSAVRKRNPGRKWWRWAYRDEETGVVYNEDPRLGALPPHWRRETDGESGPWFWNDETDETRAFDDDPRCDVENLLERGVELETIKLV